MKYLISLSGLLLLIGFILLLIGDYWDKHSFINNIGLAFTSAGITTFLFKYDLYEMLSDSGIRQSGVEAIQHGRSAMLEHHGGIESFFRRAHPKEIDICGIAMYSFFEPHQVLDVLIKLASEGYKIRIAFADPNSPELRLQEEVEQKPGSLKHHIEYLVEKINDRISKTANSQYISEQFTVVHSKLLPKAFLIRSGSKLILTQYFYRGPHNSPTFLVNDIPGGIFEQYRVYLNDVFLSGVPVRGRLERTGIENGEQIVQDEACSSRG